MTLLIDDPQLRGDAGNTQAYSALMTARTLDDIAAEYDFLDSDDRYRLLIDLGRALEPMPDPLKVESTRVQGCSANVWLYPTTDDGNSLHFLADSDSDLTKGIIALVLTTVQDRSARDILALDIFALLAPFGLERQLTSRRTQGVPNMIALIRATAGRYAEG